jgi:hypothetical protein
MADAVLCPPTHPRKKLKCLSEMSEDNNHQTSRADHLEQGSHIPPLGEDDDRTAKQDACRYAESDNVAWTCKSISLRLELSGANTQN